MKQTVAVSVGTAATGHTETVKLVRTSTASYRHDVVHPCLHSQHDFSYDVRDL